jgi:hypothetical protein
MTFVLILPIPQESCNGVRQSRVKGRMTSCSKQLALATPSSLVAMRRVVNVRWGEATHFRVRENSEKSGIDNCTYRYP